MLCYLPRTGPEEEEEEEEEQPPAPAISCPWTDEGELSSRHLLRPRSLCDHDSLHPSVQYTLRLGRKVIGSEQVRIQESRELPLVKSVNGVW